MVESLQSLFDIVQPTAEPEKGGKGWEKSTACLRIGFKEAVAFFWDVKRLERIRSNSSKDHTIREIEKRGRGI